MEGKTISFGLHFETLSPKPIEICIPLEIKKELAMGAVRVANEIINRQPEVIFVLEKGGSLAFEAVEAQLEKRRPDRPTRVITVPISKQLPDRFLSNPNLNPDNYEILDDPDLGDEELNYRYFHWLKSDPVAQNHLKKIRQGIKELDLGSPVFIFVVDDVIYHGATMLTVSELIKTAFKERNLTAVLQPIIIMKTREWQGKIYEATFDSPAIKLLPLLVQRNVRNLLYHISQGKTIDFNQETGESEVRFLNHWEGIRDLGEAIAGETKSFNPADILATIYQKNDLVSFYDRLVEKIRMIGSTAG